MNRIVVASFVVIEVAEIVERPRAGGIPLNDMLKHNHFFKPRREAMERRGGFGTDSVHIRYLLALEQRSQPRQRVKEHRIFKRALPAARLDQGESVIAKPGPGKIVDHIEQSLDVIVERGNKGSKIFLASCKEVAFSHRAKVELVER